MNNNNNTQHDHIYQKTVRIFKSATYLAVIFVGVGENFISKSSVLDHQLGTLVVQHQSAFKAVDANVHFFNHLLHLGIILLQNPDIVR